MGAIALLSGKRKHALLAGIHIDAEVSTNAERYLHRDQFNIHLPGLDREVAQATRVPHWGW